MKKILSIVQCKLHELRNELAKRNGKISFCLRMLLVVFVLLLLSTLCIHVQKSSGYGEGEPSSSESLMFIPAWDAPELDVNARNIYDWIALKNPLAILKPDAPFGYRASLPLEKKRVFIPDETTICAPVTDGRGFLVDMSGIRTVISGKEMVFSFNFAEMKAIPIPQKKLHEDKGVFWMDDKGRLLENAPAVDVSVVQKVLKSQKDDFQLQNSLLQVMPPLQDGIPRIVIRQSSGSRELDRHVLALLRRYIMYAMIDRKKLDIPDGGLNLYILWKL